MKIFLSDLWNDLRAKRLWPVALLLLAGLVAVPVVLSQSAEEPPAPAAAESPARSAPEPRELKGLASVKLEEGETEDGSTLNVFDPSDPFSPPAKVIKGAQEAEAGSGSSSGPGGADTPSGDSNVSSGSTGSTGDTGSSGTGTVTTGPGGAGGATETTTQRYAYVIDVTFSANGRTRKLKGMDRLDMLPSQGSPLLLFLGVSSNAGNAVFLVDSSLEAAGEGKCKPKASKCAFLHLGAGSQHAFTDEDGDAYSLRVDEIRKVKVEQPARAASAATTGSTAAGATSSITRVTPMRAAVGDALAIRGRNFKARRARNTIIFRAPDGRVAFAKPRRASRTKLVVGVPPAVARLLTVKDNVPQPTRLRLRVLAGHLSEYTSRRLSPVVVGFGE